VRVGHLEEVGVVERGVEEVLEVALPALVERIAEPVLAIPEVGIPVEMVMMMAMMMKKKSDDDRQR
jgi:hypothetical protein